ncbi:MAG: PAS domain-containing protein [Burkholderiales bacterium]|nr:PAS domain-containing protein [Burkholderiales bacterium]
MSAASGERRRSDRRSDDRRRTGGRRRDDALFAATLGGDSHPTESFFDPGWLAAGEMPPDSRLLLRQVRRIAAAQDTALVRVFRTYVAARAVVGVGLVVAQGLSSMLGLRHAELLALVSLVYAAQSITLWLLPRFRPLAESKPLGHQRRRQWVATIGVDILAFVGLHAIEVGSSFNYAALLVLPVLMAGVLTARLLALGTAAAVALLLLVVAWGATSFDAMAPGLMLQSGLAGFGLFIITLLAGELAGRLAREELAARGSLELARQQAQLNRLVIEEMADGVLVVDRGLRVRAANPAARSLLVDEGLAPPAPFGLAERAAWRVLHDEVEHVFRRADPLAVPGHAATPWPEAGRDVVVRFPNGLARALRVRVRFMRSSALDAPDDSAPTAADIPDEPFVVLLLEDVRTAQARLRQEKLAAMGRVSAGIAHEIRNPLAAIAQANALLLEDELAPTHQRLARIVADNVARLDRLVDDVLEVAPGSTPVASAIDARAAVAAATAEWAATAQLPLAADSRLRVQIAEAPLGVAFDAEHLRRVLVNLLDNAHRHASCEAGAVLVRLATDDDGAHVTLSVASDGPLIAPEVERYLFEPFYSTRSRGSGLGLYICRELCERYGASIEYRQRPPTERSRNEFIVSMRRAELTDAAIVLPLEP